MPASKRTGPRAPTVPAAATAVEAEALDRDEGAEWHGLVVGGDLTGLELPGVEIVGCRFVDVRLTGADLTDAVIRDTAFERCELSGVQLFGARIERVEVRSCRASGLDLGGARIGDLRVVATKADDLNLALVAGERVVFDDCDLRGAELHDARFTDSGFVDCDLRGAEVSHARLAGTRLHGSNLEGIRGARDLSGVVIGPDQQVALGLALLASLEVVVEDPVDGGDAPAGKILEI